MEVIKIGEKVKWHDPGILDYDNPIEALNRVFTVEEINDDIISISDGYTNAEVYEDELEII